MHILLYFILFKYNTVQAKYKSKITNGIVSLINYDNNTNENSIPMIVQLQ